MEDIVLDFRVLAFTFGVAAVTGTAFGLTGAWHAFRTDLNTALRDGGARQGTSRAGTRVRSAFVAVQAGLAVVLLSGAGLLIASFYRLQRVELGFDPDGVVVVAVWGVPAGSGEAGGGRRPRPGRRGWPWCSSPGRGCSSRASTGSSGSSWGSLQTACSSWSSGGCPPGTWRRGGRGRSSGRSWSGCVRSPA